MHPVKVEGVYHLSCVLASSYKEAARVAGDGASTAASLHRLGASRTTTWVRHLLFQRQSEL